MFWLLVALAVIGLVQAHPTKNVKDLHPDTGLNIMEMAEKYGYPLEVHDDIQTEDGYLLQMHRIPHGRNNSNLENRPVALLMHCLACSSGVWVAYGPEKALAFMLADLGYDVWIPNARGNMWSRKHITYDPDTDKEQFWDFSWHHIGVYDLATSIDYILENTGEEKLFYVGYSQGTTTFYVLAALRPEYNDKIRLAVTLAPIGYMSNMTNPFFQFLSLIVDELELLAKIIGWYEFLPNLELMGDFADICDDESPLGEFCTNIFFLIFGQDSVQMEETMIPVFATHLPAGSSVKQWSHYGQEIISGKFRFFDYGLIGNLNAYGQPTPPDYNTRAITAPVAFYYAVNDNMAAVVDVQQLASELPNLVKNHMIDDPTFTHLDFLQSKYVVELVYNDVIELMNQYL